MVIVTQLSSLEKAHINALVGLLTPESSAKRAFSPTTVGNGSSECLAKYARLQRRGRPGFAPEFPVVSANKQVLADHQRTFNNR